MVYVYLLGDLADLNQVKIYTNFDDSKPFRMRKDISGPYEASASKNDTTYYFKPAFVGEEFVFELCEVFYEHVRMSVKHLKDLRATLKFGPILTSPCIHPADHIRRLEIGISFRPHTYCQPLMPLKENENAAQKQDYDNQITELRELFKVRHLHGLELHIIVKA